MTEKKEQQVTVYDPARDAKYSVPISIAIVYIKESKKLEKKLIDMKLIKPEEVKLEK